MLVLDEVSYRYAGASEPALRNVTLELHDGEVLGLAGAGESGKTTLALVAAGLAPRAIGGTLSGRLLLDGQDAAGEPMHAMAGRIGIAFQNPTTQRSGVAGTVYEEVAFGPANLGVPRDELIERTETALDALRIGDIAARDPAHLSGGQQQLVAIAGLLAMRPAHLVLDEPTAQLDPEGTQLVATALAGLAERGVSILIAEHKSDLLLALCARVAVLDAGRLALVGPARSVLEDRRLAALGVPEPSGVRLRRMAVETGLDPGLLA